VAALDFALVAPPAPHEVPEFAVCLVVFLLVVLLVARPQSVAHRQGQNEVWNYGEYHSFLQRVYQKEYTVYRLL
jgi:hypothetical protein